MCCAAAGVSAHAGERFLLEALADGEFFVANSDDSGAAGDSDGIFWRGRLQAWSALQVSPQLQLYGLAQAESDDFNGNWESDVRIQELALRWSNRAEPYLEIEAGRILAPIEGISSYPLSIRNPLIGQPNSHYGGYPLGIQLSGTVQQFDYRLSVVDEPVPDVGLAPLKPDYAFRPEMTVGYTPFVGFRIGLSHARGPYLNKRQRYWLPAGADWKDYDQAFFGFDLRYSRGYAELRGGVSRAEYDLPFHSETASATDAYFEFRYTFTPRLYATVRLQRTGYEPIDIEYYTYAPGPREKATTVELGLGYRFSADTQLKLEFRNRNTSGGAAYADDSYGEEYAYDYTSGGFPADTAVALQFSHHFDFRPRYGAAY